LRGKRIQRKNGEGKRESPAGRQGIPSPFFRIHMRKNEDDKKLVLAFYAKSPKIAPVMKSLSLTLGLSLLLLTAGRRLAA
jgi:hypothetical protein